MLMVVVIRRRECVVHLQSYGEWRERQQDNHQRECSRAGEGLEGRSVRKTKYHERGASTTSVQKLSIWPLPLPSAGVFTCAMLRFGRITSALNGRKPC